MSLPENYILEKLDSDEYIALDKGFKGYQKHWSKLILPYMYAKDSEMLPRDIVFNSKFKSIRTVIENVFCEIRKFRIWSETLGNGIYICYYKAY